MGNKNVPKDIEEMIKYEQDKIEDVKKVFKKEFSNTKLNTGKSNMDGRIKSANNR